MNKKLKLFAILSTIAFVCLNSVACTSHHFLSRDANLSIKGHSRIISSDGEQYMVKNLFLDNEKVTGKSLRSGEELSLNREHIAQIRSTSHAKGLVRGAGYGALAGAGLGVMVGIADPVFMLPIAIGFASVFAIPAGTVGLLAGYQDIYNLTSDKKEERQIPNNKSLRRRSAYYGGISLKMLTGSTPNRIGGTSWENLSPLNTTAPVMEFGIALNPYLLLGVQFSPYEFEDNYYQDTSNQYNWETYADFLLVATMFPNKSGRFWKLGVGLTDYHDQSEYFNDYHVINPVKGQQSYYWAERNEQGLTTQVSLGYAFWLGEHMNLTVSADLNSHYFQWQSNSHFVGLSVGGYWY